MVFRPSGSNHDSQNRLYLILGTPRYFKQYKKHTKSILEDIVLEIFENWRIEDFEKSEKVGLDHSCRSVFLSKILNMGPVSLRKHELHFSKILNRGSIPTHKHEMDIC